MNLKRYLSRLFKLFQPKKGDKAIKTLGWDGTGNQRNCEKIIEKKGQ